METNIWEKYSGKARKPVEDFCSGYREFLSMHKTERECVKFAVSEAEKYGYRNLNTLIERGEKLREGDKVYAVNMDKAVVLFVVGKQPIEKGVNISPTVYMREYYDRFLQGEPLPALANEIMEELERCKTYKSMDISFFLSFENAKKHIVYKLVNREKNEELLKEVPSLSYMDLSIVFYYLLDDMPFHHATILIHNSHLTMWQITKEELFRQALENTPRLLPATIRRMQDVVREMMKGRQMEEALFENEIPMYIMSNPIKMNGAATMAYPGVIRNFAETIRKNLYVIPSSVHEVILVPESGTEGSDLNDMVAEVNQTQVDPKEILADHVYYYDRKEDQMLSCVHENICYC